MLDDQRHNISQHWCHILCPGQVSQVSRSSRILRIPTGAKAASASAIFFLEIGFAMGIHWIHWIHAAEPCEKLRPRLGLGALRLGAARLAYDGVT